MKTKYTFVEVCQQTGLEETVLLRFIQREWIIPSEEQSLDETDLARVQLILELKNAFGVNEESIPLILHLLDQLYYFRGQLLAHQRNSGDFLVQHDPR